MKKLKVLGLAMLLSISSVFAQKVIENPAYKARNNPIVDIVKIELWDSATVIYCNATFRPKYWIKVPATTFIQSTEGGEKLGISSAEGIAIDEEFFMPESGETSFVLYFPPLDPNTASIDFVECPASNCFNFYNILLGEEDEKVIPTSMEGDWFAVEGAGDWSYAFYDHFAVHENDFWEYGPLRQKGKITAITLTKGPESKILYAKNAQDGTLLLGPDKKKLLSYTREKPSLPSYNHISKSGFSEDSFKKGDAVIRGFIKGHSSKMGLNEGNAMVPSAFSWEGTKYEFKIDNVGRFEVTVPLEYPGVVQLDFERARTSIFVEPGSESLMVFELDEFTRTYLSAQDYSNRKMTTLFMGDGAAINNDLQMYSNQFSFDNERLMKEVAELSPEQYKADIKNQLKERLRILNELKENKRISLKASQYFENTIKLSAISELLEYNMKRRHAKYRAEGNIPDSLRTPYEEVELDLAYYDFMQEIAPDYQMGLLSDNFLIFINRVNYFKEVEVTFSVENIDSMEKQLKAKGMALSTEERKIKESMASLEGKTTIEQAVIMAEYSSLLESFHEKYSSIIGPFMADRQTEARIQNIKKYLGIKDGLVLDIVRAQSKTNLMEQYYVPMSEKELEAFDKEVGTQFVKEYVHAYNATVIKELATENDMSGVVVNEAPGVEAEILFEAMMEKYKGKVVYIDFWATWCGPCMGEMPHSKKLKEELNDKDVVFVYITNQTSPLKTWTNKIPDMKGEHFRLKPREWETLSQKFKVRGIPHYLLVDQEGKLVAENATRPSEKAKLKGEISALLAN